MSEIKLKKQKDGSYSGIQEEDNQKSKLSRIGKQARNFQHSHDDVLDAMVYAIAGSGIAEGSAVYRKAVVRVGLNE